MTPRTPAGDNVSFLYHCLQSAGKIDFKELTARTGISTDTAQKRLVRIKSLVEGLGSSPSATQLKSPPTPWGPLKAQSRSLKRKVRVQTPVPQSDYAPVECDEPEELDLTPRRTRGKRVKYKQESLSGDEDFRVRSYDDSEDDYRLDRDNADDDDDDEMDHESEVLKDLKKSTSKAPKTPRKGEFTHIAGEEKRGKLTNQVTAKCSSVKVAKRHAAPTMATEQDPYDRLVPSIEVSPAPHDRQPSPKGTELATDIDLEALPRGSLIALPPKRKSNTEKAPIGKPSPRTGLAENDFHRDLTEIGVGIDESIIHPEDSISMVTGRDGEPPQSSSRVNTALERLKGLWTWKGD